MPATARTTSAIDSFTSGSFLFTGGTSDDMAPACPPPRRTVKYSRTPERARMARPRALSWNAVSRSSTNRDLAPPPDSLRRGLAIAVAAAVALAYCLGHLGWYLRPPLGRVPVLDEVGNLSLANEIAGGWLPAEPFYRAPG